MAEKIEIRDYGQFVEMYNKCLNTLKEIYSRWFGSDFGITGNDVRHLYDLVVSGKTTLIKYKKEFNDKYYFTEYGVHLYKCMEGKNVYSYIL